MASHFPELFEVPKSHEEEQEEQMAHQRYGELMSTLPLHQGWLHMPLRRYQGFWLNEGFLPGVMALQDRFEPRTGDVILASFPKSGTTWLKALAFAATHRAARHTLLQRHTQDCVVTLDEIFGRGRIPNLDALPAPRLLSTHLPYSMLPKSVQRSECRIVYVCRDPKDTLISLWRFVDAMKPENGECLTLDKAFELFCAGTSPYGPVWDHQLEYWQESLRRPQRVLFLRYEELKEDTAGNVRKLAEFMGRPFSEEDERDGLVEEIVRLCSIEKLRSVEANKEGVRRQVEGKWVINNASFFRKGEVGDWKNNLTPEMARMLDDITHDKFRASGLGDVSEELPQIFPSSISHA